MQNLTIGGHYFGQVFGSTLPGPIWKRAMEAALAAVPKTKFDLITLDGLGTFVPPPPPSPTPSPSVSGTPAPGGKPKPTTGPTPKPATSPSPKPT